MVVVKHQSLKERERKENLPGKCKCPGFYIHREMRGGHPEVPNLQREQIPTDAY